MLEQSMGPDGKFVRGTVKSEWLSEVCGREQLNADWKKETCNEKPQRSE